jgi:phosphoglycolate phosphatase-like HAD superfamily hydrolase
VLHLKLLAFDFDGVICDGLKEICLTAYNTYLRFHPDTNLLDGRFLTTDAFDEFDDDKRMVFDQFARLFAFGNKAESQYVIFRIMEEKRDVETEAGFNRFKSQLDSERLGAYYDRFYDERSRFKAANYDGWLGLNRIYPGMKESLNTLCNHFYPVIATSKDKTSVLDILKAHGLDRLFQEENVLDRECGLTKDIQINMFKEKFNIKEKDIFFIDDRLQVIVPVKNLGVNCYLATWGSNSPEQQKAAEKQGIDLLTLENLTRKLIRISGEVPL